MFLKTNIYFSRENRHQDIILFSLLIIFVVLCLLHAFSTSLTYDELDHYRYGRQILSGNSNRFDDSKMPFSVLNIITVKVVNKFFPSFLNSLWQGERIGRIATILFTVLLILYIYRWIREWYGTSAALICVGLFTFEPNILAHASLITTDLYATGMVTISVYYFWKFLQDITWKRALVSACSLGISQLAKYTCIFLYPLFLIMFFWYFLRKLKIIFTSGDKKVLVKGLKRFLFYCLFFIAINVCIINLGFLFNKSFTPLGKYHFRSELFQSVQNKLTLFEKVPVPLPYPYLEGLDFVRYRERSGEGYGHIYLLGKLREHGMFPGYYLIVFLLKVPISILLFLLLAVIQYLVNSKKRFFREKEFFILVPAIFFALYFNFFYRAQIGIRFFLVIFPFLFIFCGNLFQNVSQFSLKKKAIMCILALYLIISVASYTPHYLAYFNAFIGNRKNAYRFLADSNLDWGQNERRLNLFLKENPDVLFEPKSPVSGRIIVSVNMLTGAREGPVPFAWLRDHFKPVDHLAYSYLIYDISEEDLVSIPFEINE